LTVSILLHPENSNTAQHSAYAVNALCTCMHLN